MSGPNIQTLLRECYVPNLQCVIPNIILRMHFIRNFDVNHINVRIYNFSSSHKLTVQQGFSDVKISKIKRRISKGS